MAIKIGNHELSEDETRTVNDIVTSFLGEEHKVISGATPKYGRSKGNNTHYCLKIDDGNIVSVKLAFNAAPEIIQWELFMGVIRQLLSIPHYRIEKKNNFPLSNWKNQDFIIFEKGPEGNRNNLDSKEIQQSINENKEIFLTQIAKLAALNYLFGISDRSMFNFVWDKKEKVLYSIDHEILANSDEDVPSDIKKRICSFLPNNWFDDEGLRTKFTESFLEIWQKVVDEEAEIIGTFALYELQKHSGKFLERIKKGSQWVLQRIMS